MQFGLVGVSRLFIQELVPLGRAYHPGVADHSPSSSDSSRASSSSTILDLLSASSRSSCSI